MNLLKRIIDFYIFSNLHVAIAGFCMTKITLLDFGIETNITPLFVALSIVVSYNFIRYYEIKTNRLTWFESWFFKNKFTLLILSVIAVVGIGYILFFKNFNLRSFYILFPFAFMTFFYVNPLFEFKNKEVSFRNFPSIKIFSIAITWAGISVLFPLYEQNFEFDNVVYLEFFKRFLLLIAITLPFDIRDVFVDSRSLKTLPQVLGVKNTKIFGVVLLLLFVLLEIYENSIFTSEVYISIVIAILTGLFLGFSSPKNERYYTAFWVESIPIIWFGLIVLF